jgi:hypothetical protein
VVSSIADLQGGATIEEAHAVARPRKKLKELHYFTCSYDVMVNHPKYSFSVI